jgi:hypothetical protein
MGTKRPALGGGGRSQKAKGGRAGIGVNSESAFPVANQKDGRLMAPPIAVISRFRPLCLGRGLALHSCTSGGDLAEMLLGGSGFGFRSCAAQVSGDVRCCRLLYDISGRN